METSENEATSSASEHLEERQDTPYQPEQSLRPTSAKINKVAPLPSIKTTATPTESHSSIGPKLDRIKTHAIIEDITLCPMCKKSFNDPHSLPCFHVFCKECLAESVVAGKIECCLCDKIHSVLHLERVIRPSNMTKFLVDFKKNKFDGIEITEGEKIERDGICLECNPPIPESKRKKADLNEPEIEPILVSLSVCFHCQEQLCNSCRLKHYNSLRKETLKSLIYYGEGSDNIVSTAQQLNDARKDKILDYEKFKLDVAERKVQLIEKLEKEEQNLVKRLDDEIALEKRNIELGRLKLARHVANRDLTKTVYQKVVNEKNFKRLNEMCGDFLAAQTEWKHALNGEAAAIDPNKETKVQFSPSKLKEEIIGTIDQRRGNLKIQTAVIPGVKKSSVCNIL